MEKPAQTQVPIHELIARRWSGRAFDPARGIEPTALIALLEAARWAPSCYGDQPWRLVVCDKGADPEGWQAAFDSLSPGNRSWAERAPLLVLVCADTLFNHNGQPNRHAQYDTGAAAVSLCLQATALGLMAHQMGGFDAASARVAFNVPDQFSLMAMVAVGYPAPMDSLAEDVREHERKPRARRALGELFFSGSWGRAVI